LVVAALCAAGASGDAAGRMEGAGGGRGGRELAASCGLGSGTVGWYEGLVVPDTTGIRLQTAAGTPSFDSEGQVQGRLEVRAGDDWVNVEGYSGSLDSTDFEEEEATVACRPLGSELGYALVSSSAVSKDNTDTPTSGIMYEVHCTGVEDTLESCTSFGAWHGNVRDWAVGVSCTFLAPGDECEECVAGKYSDTSGVAACTSCTAGSYSTVGAASCEQVRWGGGEASAKPLCR
jgi:hypothetical protein